MYFTYYRTPSVDAVTEEFDEVTEACLDCRSTGKYASISNLKEFVGNPGSILAVVNDNSLIRITIHKEMLYLTGTRFANDGLVDGELKKARFTLITSFLQLNATFILVVDSGGSCIRSVDLIRGQVDSFSGYCIEEKQDDFYPSQPAGRYISYLYPYHLVSDPLDQKFVYLTDKNYVRKIDIHSRYVTIVYDHPIKEDKIYIQWKGGVSSKAPTSFQLRWMAFLNNFVYITSKNHGLLVLDRNWKLEKMLHPEQTPLLSYDSLARVSLNHVYPISTKKLLITFVGDNGWFSNDPQTILFNIERPGESYILEQRSNLKDKLQESISSVNSISWFNRQLVFTGTAASENSECLPMVSASFPGNTNIHIY